MDQPSTQSLTGKRMWGDEKRNEILERERGAWREKKKKVSKETSGFDYEDQHRQASLCCLF